MSNTYRTELSMPHSGISISHQTSVVLMGSCFSDTIGQRLMRDKFRTVSNPMGTIYNPLIIAKIITDSLSDSTTDELRVIERDSIHLHLDYHSDVRASTREDLLLLIAKKKATLKEALSPTDSVLYVTLGSAWGYTYLADGQIVGNCHKLPSQSFSKGLITSQQIIDAWSEAIDQLEAYNPNLKIVFTVSPVRHHRDGLVENNRSKAQLLSAVHDLCDAHERVSYFPSYELVMDDLRDYRFFADDMVHPSDQAVSYVYDRFLAMYCQGDTPQLLDRIRRVVRACGHRPFSPDSKAHQQFIEKTLSQLEQLENELGLDFRKERELLGR